jgi:hypothetical protein
MKYHITAQNKAGQWKNRVFSTLYELIHEYMYWKALQYPFIAVQRKKLEEL